MAHFFREIGLMGAVSSCAAVLLVRLAPPVTVSPRYAGGLKKGPHRTIKRVYCKHRVYPYALLELVCVSVWCVGGALIVARTSAR